jgi:hypothetical protein
VKSITPLVRTLVLKPGLALFLLLCGWYILTSSGHTYTSDEETMLAAGESLIEEASFRLPHDFLMNINRGVDNQPYSRYGPGQSVAVVPFLLAGNLVALTAPPYASTFILRLFALLLPALVTAATGLLLYAWAREIGYHPRIALLVGLLYGFSMAWPYSRTFFAEPLATFFLVLCAYSLRREERRWWVLAGVAAGVALTVKLQVLLLMPLIAGYGLLICLYPGGVCPACSRMGAVVGRLTMGMVGIIIPLCLFLLYNTMLFGGPLETGYGGVDPTGLLEWPWQEGAYGLLFSSGKGILLYSSTVLVGIAGTVFRWSQQWRESLLALGVLVVNVAFYSQLSYWHGDGSWGPRYMVFVLPFVYLPAAGLLATIAERRIHLATALVGILAVLTFLVQLLPVLVNFNTYIQMADQRSRHFTPAASPLVGHTRLWLERASEWWLRVDPPAGVAVLRNGFSYSEGERNRIQGDVLPRWTYAEAHIQLYPFTDEPLANQPLEGRIVAGDHRPWPLERATFGLLLDNELLANVQRTDMTGDNIIWELRFRLPPEQVERGAMLTIRSDTWNPDDDTEDNPRDENLGVLIETLEFQQNGQMLDIREALPIPTVTRDRHDLWLWYYDTPRHHLFDAWLWYVFVAGLPPFVIALLLLLVGVPSLVMLVFGGWGVSTHLRLLSLRRHTQEEGT